MCAYNENYVEDIANLQEILFQEITRYKYEIDYTNFVKGYMRCRYRDLLDKGNARIANMTWDELLCYLERDCSSIIISGKTDVDRLQSGWIGRMYSLLQYRKNMSSKELYDKLPLDRMRALFVPLHTVSEDVALEKMDKII